MVMLGAVTLAGDAVAAAGIDVWAAPAAQKVFQDDTPPAGVGPDLRLEAAGGETESAQVVLRAEGEACTLTDAAVSEFRNERDEACPDVTTGLFQVAFIHLPSLNRSWPDPLPPFRGPLQLLPDRTQPLWLSVQVPPAAPAGTYRATLRLVFDSAPARIVPLTLRVFGFRLPEQPSLRTAIGNQMGFVLPHHGVQAGTPEAATLERNYYEFLLQRRLSPYSLPCDLCSPEAARWLDDPRLTSFVIPVSDDDAEFRRVTAHLRDRDWLKRASSTSGTSRRPRTTSISSRSGRVGSANSSRRPRLWCPSTATRGRRRASRPTRDSTESWTSGARCPAPSTSTSRRTGRHGGRAPGGMSAACLGSRGPI